MGKHPHIRGNQATKIFQSFFNHLNITMGCNNSRQRPTTSGENVRFASYNCTRKGYISMPGTEVTSPRPAKVRSPRPAKGSPRKTGRATRAKVYSPCKTGRAKVNAVL